LPDGLLGDGAIRIVHEGEATRPSGFPIEGQHNGSGGTDARQVLAQLSF
jgi:hypothetical protein